METSVTAIEMRRKFGGILDRVVFKGDHITIMRGGKPLATLIPASEHQQQCLDRDRVRTVQEALAAIDEWRRKHPEKVRKLAKVDSTRLIRKMRDSRWSSLTPRSH